MNSETFEQLILDIYDTALAPENWQEVLLKLATCLGARGAVLFEVLEGEDNERLIAPYFSANYQKELVHDYVYNFQDFELGNQSEFARIASNFNNIELINDVEFGRDWSSRTLSKAHSKLAQHNIAHRSGTILNKDCWNLDRFSAQYSEANGPATSEQKKAARLILPHLAKALRIGRPLIDSRENWHKRFQARLDELSYGVAIITPNCEPILTNIEFRKVLDAGMVFRRDSKGRLSIRQNSNFERFEYLLSSIEFHSAANANPRNQSICFANVDQPNELGILVEISPISFHTALERFPSGSRLITVFDCKSRNQVNLDALNKFFKLSKSELETLTLAICGMTNPEIADTRCRSIETINSQIKSIFRKTYTRNRTELVQLAYALNSPFSKEWLS